MRVKRYVALVALTVAAMLALTGIAAASGGGIVADKYPATLKNGSEWPFPKTEFRFVVPPGYGGECTPEISSTVTKPTSPLSISSVTCFGMNMNGCSFEFHPGSKTFDIGPAKCAGIKYSSTQCEILIYPQTGLAATYTNTGSGEGAYVNISFEDGSVEYSTIPGGWCGNGGSKYMTFIGKLNVAATNESKEKVGVYSYENTAPVGVFMQGKEWPEVTLGAQAYPTSLVGEAGAKATNLTLLKVMTVIGSLPITCETMSTSASLAEAAHEISFSSFSGCTMFGEPATVKANGCGYLQHGFEGPAPFYQGTSLLACAKEGEGLEVTAPVFPCTVKILPTKTFTPFFAEYENVGKGIQASVHTKYSGKNVEFTQSGSGCGLITGKTGTLNFDFSTHGVYTG